MKGIFLFLTISITTHGLAQTKRSLETCEVAFMQNNLMLLAAQYQINEAEADIIQARIWELPQASYETNIINPENKTIFGLNKANSIGIQQLLYLGGKKKQEQQYYQSQLGIAKLDFSQLMANLKTQIRQTYYTLYFEEKKRADTESQLKYMEALVKNYRVQTAKGNTSLKDQVRLQALTLQLTNDRLTIMNQILDLQQNLKVLTGWEEPIETDMTENMANQLLTRIPLDNMSALIEKAWNHNAEYQSSLQDVVSNRINEKWQQALNKPDITLGLQFDQMGGAFANQINITAGIPIPLWKKNKGNILKAGHQLKTSETNSAYKKLALQSMVEQAYKIWQQQFEAFSHLIPQDQTDLNTVYTGMLSNFQKGNINLMQFTDFMDSYRESILQLYEIKKQVILSGQELERLTQSKIF